MFIRILVLLLCTTISLQAGLWDSVKIIISKEEKNLPMVSVLIIHDQPGVMLEVSGKYHVYDPNSGERLGSRVIGKNRYMQVQPAGLKWGEEFPGIYQLSIVPDSSSVVTLVNGVTYKGELYIYDVGGTISVVNRLPIEDYLSAILPTQFQDSMPIEFLAAMAISTRTRTLYEVQNSHSPYWTVDGQITGYHGVAEFSPESDLAEALHTTSGMVLSTTGSYEGVVTPLPCKWRSDHDQKTTHEKALFSRITLAEAEEMARKGDNAAQILGKAFPGSSIEVIR